MATQSAVWTIEVASSCELAVSFGLHCYGTVHSKEIGRVEDVGWALLPVSGEPVGQEWPTYD